MNLGNMLTNPIPDDPSTGKPQAVIDWTDSAGVPIDIRGYYTTDRAESSYGIPVIVLTSVPPIARQELAWNPGDAVYTGDIVAAGATLRDSNDDDGRIVVDYS